MTTAAPIKHKIVSKDEWIAAENALLQKEKEFTRARDVLSAALRELPWVKVETDYIFEDPDGEVSLSNLFDLRTRARSAGRRIQFPRSHAQRSQRIRPDELDDFPRSIRRLIDARQ